jgi:hypothetical protein
MNRILLWSMTLVAALVAYCWTGPTPLSAACPPVAPLSVSVSGIF